MLVVHDASYTETTFDGYVAPSFLATPGAAEVGVEVFSLSKGWNMTGWRTAAVVGNPEAVEAYWRLKTNIDSGMFEAVQLAAATALDAGPPAGMRRCTRAGATWSAARCAAIGVDVTHRAARSTCGRRCRRATLGVVLRAGAGGVRRGRVARWRVRAERRGLLPHLADRGGRAPGEAVERLRSSMGG